jgi:acyl carrier protein
MPDYQTCVDYILGVLEPRNRGTDPLGEETDLVADIGLSSLQVMELIERLEDHFDISIPLNILPDITTVGDLAARLRDLDG